MHLCSTFPFRIWWKHLWKYFSDHLKRECCRCGREEWLMTRRFPQVGQPASFWKNMSRKPFIR